MRGQSTGHSQILCVTMLTPNCRPKPRFTPASFYSVKNTASSQRSCSSFLSRRRPETAFQRIRAAQVTAKTTARRSIQPTQPVTPSLIRQRTTRTTERRSREHNPIRLSKHVRPRTSGPRQRQADLSFPSRSRRRAKMSKKTRHLLAKRERSRYLKGSKPRPNPCLAQGLSKRAPRIGLGRGMTTQALLLNRLSLEMRTKRQMTRQNRPIMTHDPDSSRFPL